MLALSLMTILALVPQETLQLRTNPPVVALAGPGSYATCLVEGKFPSGQSVDLSSEATLEVENPTVGVIFQGRVRAVAQGNTRILVRWKEQTLSVPLQVGNAIPPLETFEQNIMPLLSRHQCNSSGCHGKAEGQNGFKLSVFGSDPDQDFEAVVREGRGRRVFAGSPENSLFVRKMSGGIFHGGGARIPPNHPDYITVLRWLDGGAMQTDPTRPAVVSIRMESPFATMSLQSSKKLLVFAKYGDGSEKEVTAHARFFSNHESLAGVDMHGLVTASNTPGEAAIIATYLNKTAVFRALLPRPASPIRMDVTGGNWIDKPIVDKLTTLRIPPSGQCSDAEFCRRVYLDIVGVLPTPIQAREFLARPAANKRAELVNELLSRPEYADLWSLVWSDILRVDAQALGSKQAYAYYRWIHRGMEASKPLDVMAKEILSAQGALADHPEGSIFKVVTKPGEMAGAAAQVFLGVRITCAECHHHPFDKWSQEDYLGMQSFFTGVQFKNLGKKDVLIGGQTAPGTNPRAKAKVFAHALGQPVPDKQPQGDARIQLADWVTRPDNPYFARNMANRIWAHFMGHGLVEPVDDIRETNPPTHPELLDGLAKHLVNSRFDTRELIRAITSSQAYQRSSSPIPGNEGDEWNYSRFPLKGMLAEVLLDAISQATGVPEAFEGYPQGTRAVQLWDSRQKHYFLKIHGRPVRISSCSCERQKEGGVARVLHELNSPLLQRKLAHEQGRVAQLAASPAPDESKVDELYLAFLSRLPDAKEKKLALEFLSKSRDGSHREKLEDLAWGLMNSLEFLFNH